MKSTMMKILAVGVVLCGLAGCGDDNGNNVDLASGLVARYSFDYTGGYPLDLSGNGHNTNEGGAWGATDHHGTANGALDFVASSGWYLAAPDSPAFDFGSGDWAVSFWFNPRAANDQPLINRYSNGDWAWDVRLGWGGGTCSDCIYMYSGTSPGTLVLASGSVALNNWHHLVAQRKSGNLYTWLDGVMFNAGSETGVASGASKLYFGKFNGYGSPTYDGLMDNVRIYNRALNIDEINTLRAE